MQLSISYRHMESTPSIENKIREKAEHLEKYFKGNGEIKWVCMVEKGRHSSEVQVHAGHHYFHAHAENDNLYKTMDEALEKIEKQIRRKDKKEKDKRYRKIS